MSAVLQIELKLQTPNTIDMLQQHLDETLEDYKRMLRQKVGRVRVFGEDQIHTLERVFVELTIAEGYEHPSSSDEWWGMMDAELRQQRGGTFAFNIIREYVPHSEELSEDDPEEYIPYSERSNEDDRYNNRSKLKPDGLLREGTRAIIVGAPGCGKTTLLRWLALQVCDLKTNLWPIFLELKSIDSESFKDEKEDLVELLFKKGVKPITSTFNLNQSQLDLLKCRFIKHLAEGKAAIFLDGLDEVRGFDFFSRLCEAVNIFIQSYGKNLIVITTRPYALRDKKFEVERELEIMPLNQRQIEEFVGYYYPNDKAWLLPQLKQHSLRPLVRVPTLLGFLVQRIRKHGDVESDRLKLYDGIIRDYVVKLDSLKNTENYRFRDRDSERRINFLKYLAYERLFDSRNEIGGDGQRFVFTGENIQTAAERFCEKQQADPYDLAADIKATPLVREVSEDRWAFTHLTFQEYLAAINLSSYINASEDIRQLFYRSFFNQKLVELEVLPMTLGLVPNANDLYTALEQLPESLNFANLRLRARGLSYGANVSQPFLSRIANRMCEFILGQQIEERNYRQVIIQSCSMISSMALSVFIDRFTKLLHSEDREARWNAAQALGVLGGDAAVAALTEAMKDEDRDVRSEAARAIGQIGGDQSIDALTKALKSEYDDLRWSAAQALGQIGGVQATAALIEELKSAYCDVLWSVALAIGHIGGDQASAALIEALASKNREMRWCIAEALGQIGDDKVEVALIEALSSKGNDVRESIALVLGQIGSKRAVPALMIALKSKGHGLRYRIVEALSQIKSDQAVTTLIQTLNDKDKYVRRISAQALGQIGDSQAVTALIKALNDKDMYVRRNSAQALGQIGGSQAVTALIKALNNKDGDARESVVEALGQIGGDQAVTALIKALNDKDGDARESVVEALGEVGGEKAVAALIEALDAKDSSLQSSAAITLGKIGGDRAVTVLVEALNHESSAVKWDAIMALGQIGDDRSVAALIEVANSTNSSLRLRAIQALELVSTDQTLAVLLKALKDENSDVRGSAVNALAKIGELSLAGGLRSALNSDDDFVRRKSAQIVGYYTIDDRIFQELFRLAITDQVSDVRTSAREALRTFKRKLVCLGVSMKEGIYSAVDTLMQSNQAEFDCINLPETNLDRFISEACQGVTYGGGSLQNANVPLASSRIDKQSDLRGAMKTESKNLASTHRLLSLPVTEVTAILGAKTQGELGTTPPSRIPRVFLSYAHHDQEAVSILFDKLVADGFAPWMDVKCIYPGQEWRTVIEDAIREAHFFLLCLSKHSVNRRGFLKREIQMALDKLPELLDDDIYFVPVRLVECDLPTKIARYQAVNLFEPDGYSRLLMALREGFARRASDATK